MDGIEHDANYIGIDCLKGESVLEGHIKYLSKIDIKEQPEAIEFNSPTLEDRVVLGEMR